MRRGTAVKLVELRPSFDGDAARAVRIHALVSLIGARAEDTLKQARARAFCAVHASTSEQHELLMQAAHSLSPKTSPHVSPSSCFALHVPRAAMHILSDGLPAAPP